MSRKTITSKFKAKNCFLLFMFLLIQHSGSVLKASPLSQEMAPVINYTVTHNDCHGAMEGTINLSISGVSIAAPTDLLITEVINGSGNNKCVEIFNGTGESIMLNNYQVNFYNSVGAITLSIGLNGALADGAVYVVCHDNSDPPFLNLADALLANLSFDGKTSIELYNNNTSSSADLFGNIGCDPGTGWSDAGVSTFQESIERKASSTVGVTTDPSNVGCPFPTLGTDWVNNGLNSVGSLGQHVCQMSYSVDWDIDGLGDNDDEEDLSGLAAGTYIVQITDFGITTSETITITEPSIIVPNVAVDSEISCNGSSDGELSVSPSGGIGPYTFEWSTGLTNASIDNLSSGTYSVTVTDANGCSKSSTKTIWEPFTLYGYAHIDQAISCNNSHDGQATAGAIGGTSPYSFFWSNGNPTPTAIQLEGNYTVTVTDANGCQDVIDIQIFEPNAIEPYVILEQNVSCLGGNDGILSVKTNGGEAPFTYLWSNGATSQIIMDVSSGTYSASITDSHGCKEQASFNFTPSPGTGPCAPSVALPVNLISFFGEKVDDGNRLYWETTEEVNISHYQIEKLINGRFLVIGTKEAVGENQGENNFYTFFDGNPAYDDYYRLSILELDGTFEYSEVIHISSKLFEEFTVFPNPTSGKINLYHDVSDNVQYLVRIIDGFGRILREDLMDFEAGNNIIPMEIQSFPNGTYCIQVINTENKGKVFQAPIFKTE